MRLPKTAYLVLWYPLPSETFIFREVENLKAAGLPLSVYTLYGPAKKDLSEAMRRAAPGVVRLGVGSLPGFVRDLLFWRRTKPAETAALWREIPWRRWSCLEVAGENLWALAAGFILARKFLADGMEHIHAGWANGPATAAWVASRLTGIPFSFSGRAGDIYPPDGALAEKMREAAFIHTNNRANVAYLAAKAPQAAAKIHHVYNSLTLASRTEAKVRLEPPYRLLAVGRFCRTKGFDVLLQACALLNGRGFPFQLTLVGAGLPWPTLVLRRLVSRLGLTGRVFLPGFVTHDRIAELYASSDMCLVPSVIHATGDRDGIPNVIMEALAHRLPVVATAVCGIPEVIEDGVTGRLVRERDPAALADAVMAMAESRDRAVALAEAGRERVMTMFDPETNTAALLALFATLAGRPQGPAA